MHLAGGTIIFVAFVGRHLSGDPLGGRFVSRLVDTMLDGLCER